MVQVGKMSTDFIGEVINIITYITNAQEVTEAGAGVEAEAVTVTMNISSLDVILTVTVNTYISLVVPFNMVITISFLL